MVRCTQLRALNTRKEVTGIPEDECNDDKGSNPELLTGVCMEIYWQQIIQVARHEAGCNPNVM